MRLPLAPNEVQGRRTLHVATRSAPVVLTPAWPVFVVAAFYGALRHNFFGVFFARDHPVNAFTREYHGTISQVLPFTKWGYVMFANRQPARFTFTGFHLIHDRAVSRC